MKKFAVVVVVIVALVAISFSPLLNIKTITVNDDYKLTDKDAAWLYKQNWLWNKSEWLAENMPSSLTYQEVFISKNNLRSIEISATAREPFIAVKSGGYYVIIDMYGVVLDLLPKPEAPYVIEGFNVTSAMVGKPLVAEEMQLIERAVQIVYMFKENTDYEPSIKLQNKRIIQKMTDDIYIDFGRGDNVELQFNKALVAYQNLIDNAGTSGIVNVSNPNQCIIEPLKR